VPEPALPRLRQVVLAARDLARVAGQLEAALALRDPFRDPGVGHFGLTNAVYAAGDCFVEIVSPVADGTAAGRQIDRRGGDCGYMVMFELADADGARKRLAELGVRVVHESSHPDIVDLHLHPKDVPGAIVALDITEPPGSWRWGGPSWEGTVPAHEPGGLRAITVSVTDPLDAAQRWAGVLGVPAEGSQLRLADDQRVRFRSDAAAPAAGLVEVELALPERDCDTEIAGVRFRAGVQPTEG
jgi:hypothetical protein